MWIERTKTAALVALILATLEAAVIYAVFSGPALAHEAAPAVIDVTLTAPDQVVIRVDLDARGVLARVEGVDHEALADLPHSEVIARLNVRPDVLGSAVAVIGSGGQLPVATKGIDLNGVLDLVASGPPTDGGYALIPSEILGDALVRVRNSEAGEVVQTTFAASGETAAIKVVQASRQTAFAVAGEYLVAGFDHILPKGLDHILFVIALFLLSPAIRPLFIQVSLFTVAHTLTLALAATGVIVVPSAIVEPLIAASIAFIAVENVFRSSLSHWRPFVIFGFGLLHGLGFASVLADFGLPAEQFVVALAAFNVGVEVGQLTVLAFCFLSVGLFFSRPWYRRGVVIPASLALAGVGLYWFVERVAGSVT